MLWTIGNPKTQKSIPYGYLTGVLHLAPHDSADPGGHSVCPHATPSCIALCLNTSGRGGIIKTGETTNAILEARKRRTRGFWHDRSEFASQLTRDARKLSARATKLGLKLALRLNGTSDLDWERINPTMVDTLSRFSVLYDYTKSTAKAKRTADRIDYTLSWTGENDAKCLEHVAAGGKLAVVFALKPNEALPRFWRDIPVVDGDSHDLTFLRPKACIIGLRAKGRARRGSWPNFVVADF